MKNLVLATLIGGSLAQLTGCIIVGDDDGNNPPPPPPPDAGLTPDAEPPPGPGEFLVTWTLLGGEAQTEVTCPPNGVDIRITADPDPEVSGDEDIYLYDCAAGAGVADGLPPAIYDVWVELLDPDGVLVAQSDIEADLALDYDEQFPLDFQFSVDRGVFAITWDITDAGAPATCEDVGGDIVSLLLTVANSTEADDFIFSCEAGQGVSDPMPLTDYVGVVSLLDDNGTPDDPGDDDLLGDSIERNLSLTFGNEFQSLGSFTFAF